MITHFVLTEKQENIIKAALQLFAEEGYNGTSTGKIAKKAGVSEGLIFKHFTNKQGLLDAILKEGGRRVYQVYASVMTEEDPALVIKKSIELPFTIDKDEYEFWRLQHKLKWEVGYDSSTKLKPLMLTLSDAFKQLGYKQSDLEAELLLGIIDQVGVWLLKGQMSNAEKMKRLILSKYKL